jgi:hypothetical protein
VANGWEAGATRDVQRRWSVDELDEVIPGLVAESAANAGMDGQRPTVSGLN